MKLATQLFGDRMIVANATGCTQAWGFAPPSLPYTTNAAGRGPALSNSLFENNAEYSLGMCLSVQQQRDKTRTHVEQLGDAITEGALKDAVQTWLDGYDDSENSRQTSTALTEALLGADLAGDAAQMRDQILQERENLVKKSMWMYGGDGWAYDIGYGGLDHVIASGIDVNILIVDTELYSNTGGQASKATQKGAVAKFAAAGKRIKKKDLGLIAMQYGYVYVASVALGADPNQLIKVMKEAEAFHGPSLIIGYAPCINHGITKSMGWAQEEAKAAVQCGYWNLYRYNPDLKKQGKNPLILDSKEPNYDLETFMKGEVRFASLNRSFPETARQLAAEAVMDAKEKYAHYEHLASL